MPRAGLRAVRASASARQAEPALGDEAALDLVRADRDHPHQRMAQALLPAAVPQRTRRVLRERRTRAQEVERRLVEALHQLARIDLADGAHLGRRRAARRELRAVDHEAPARLDLGRERADAVARDRVACETLLAQ